LATPFYLREAMRVTVVEICEAGEEAAAQEHIDDVARYLTRPDMDAALNSASDRYDGCHMSGTGARKLARLWTQAIAAPVPGAQPRSELR
jgi:hypothetical protein